MPVDRPNIDATFNRLQLLAKHDGPQTDPNKTVLLEREGSIATLTINRPNFRNAVDTVTWRALAGRFDELAQERDVRAIVLQGAQGHFSAGADVAEIARLATAMKGQSAHELQEVAYDYFTVARDTLYAIDNNPAVVIARMEGSALGIGNILALTCDRRVADATIRTGIPAGILGIMLDPRELRRLVLHVGISNANLMIFSGDTYNADESRRMGQIDTLVKPARTLDEEVQLAAQKAARQSKGAIITAKAGFALIAGNPGFSEDAILADLKRYYAWADDEAVSRIETFQRRREQPKPP